MIDEEEVCLTDEETSAALDRDDELGRLVRGVFHFELPSFELDFGQLGATAGNGGAE